MDFQGPQHPIKFKIKVQIVSSFSLEQNEVELSLETLNWSKFLEKIGFNALDDINCPVMKIYKGSQPCITVFITPNSFKDIQFVLFGNTIRITNNEGVVGFVFDELEQNYRIEIAARRNTIFSIYFKLC
jgi:hypothetical protein